ncbi:MAG: DUF262 domain-containing protein [Sarcina sp.]
MFTEKIKAKEYFIKDLLSPKFIFEIPDYQRAYSWTTENLKQLVDDIEDSIRLNQGRTFENFEPYFIGSIVLCGKEYKEDGFGRYEVIDGQQRLTSLIMLIATIRDIINNDEYKKVLGSLIYQEANELMGIKENIRVKVRGKESDFFKEYVLTEGGTNLVLELDKLDLTETKLNMINALEVFRNSFIDENGILLEAKLNDFVKYLLQKVVLVVITTNSFESAFRLFNVINSRGLPLTNADLLKSENLRVIPLEERTKYTDIWENDELDLGKDNLETVIGFMRSIALQKKADASLYDEYTKDIYPSKEGYKGKEFTQHMHDVKEIYSKYVLDARLNLSNKEDEIYYKNLITAMKEFLPYEDWAATIIKFVEKFGQNDEAVFEFVKLLEKRVVIDWVNGNSFADRLSRVYDIIKTIDTASTLEDIKSSEAFIGDLDKTTIFFKNALTDIDFYSKGRMTVPKYVFVRMDIELNKGESVDYYTNKVMIEHVLPRNAKDAYWVGNFKADQRRNWANKFGNLVLIAGAKNTRLNNKPYNEKVEEYLSKKGSFKITNEIFKNSEWTMEVVEERQNDLVERALKMWTEF